jgi:hypothetical protein
MSDLCSLPVDHVGVLGPDIDALVAQYRRLGFRVVGPAELTGIGADGNAVSLGQESAHVMFADTYIELTAVTAPSPEHHLTKFLAGPAGLRIVILRAGDIDAAHLSCARAALQPTTVAVASRKVEYGRPGTAHFRWFALPAARFPEALVGFVQHDTCDTVFQNEVTAHDNGATGLSRLFLTDDALPERFAPLAAPEGGTVIDTRPRVAMDALFATDVSACPPFAGIGLAVADMLATCRWLDRNRVPCREVDEGVVVSPEHGGGVGLLFESAQ